MPYLGWILLVAVAIAAYWMRSYRTGRDLYAIGSNPEAARLAGVPVGSRVFLAFVLSGGIAGVAGVLWLSKYGSVDAIAGQGYEFQVIAAVVVGGVAIFGGSGTVRRRRARRAAPEHDRQRARRRQLRRRTGRRRSPGRCCCARSPSTG